MRHLAAFALVLVAAAVPGAEASAQDPAVVGAWSDWNWRAAMDPDYVHCPPPPETTPSSLRPHSRMMRVSIRTRARCSFRRGTCS